MSFGISTALLTPFEKDGSIDLKMLSDHANQVLVDGANGVTLFGTTGEGASIGFEERSDAIAVIVDNGISAEQLTVGLCGSAVVDVANQVHQGVSFGVTNFLLLPPFYFKGVDDDGLFAWHAELFRATSSNSKFILYHIPQVSHVPLSNELVRRLKSAFPDRVLALKNSADQWNDTRMLLETGEIPVLVGDERLLHKAAALGGAGSICGMANLYPQRLQEVFDSQVEDAALSSEIDLIVSMPVIPALKHILAETTGKANWTNIRAPLMPLNGQEQLALATVYAQKVPA